MTGYLRPGFPMGGERLTSVQASMDHALEAVVAQPPALTRAFEGASPSERTKLHAAVAQLADAPDSKPGSCGCESRRRHGPVAEQHTRLT